MSVPEFHSHPLSTAQVLVEKLAIYSVTQFDESRAEMDRRIAVEWLSITAERMGYRLVRKDAPDA
jgi:hypothetical protein